MKNLHRSLVAALAAATLLSLSACSDTATPDATETPTASPSETATSEPTSSESASPTESSVPTPTVSVDPKTGQYDWCNPEQQAPFTGEAAETFGAENVMDAYCSMVDVTMENSFIDSLLRAEDGFTKQDFEAPRSYMLEEVRKDYDADVAKILNGTETAGEAADVRALVGFNGYNGSGYTMDTPAIYNQSFSPAKTWVDTAAGGKRLGLEFTVAADVALTRDSDGKEMAHHAAQTLTFWLVPGTKQTEKSWYIDGYRAAIEQEMPVPRKELIKLTDEPAS